jgi:Bacterial Ig-like domain
MQRPILIAALVASMLIGCSGDSKPPTFPSSPALINVTPANGETDVPLDAGVTLTFSDAVDRELLQRDMHLICGAATEYSECGYGDGQPHPDMHRAMTDPTVMHHFDDHHSTAGGYSWNAAGTVCTFHPNTRMTPHTQYMIHIGSVATGMHGGSMHGMMGDHGWGTTGRDMKLHFTTTSSSGG